jgi:uracil phosphoribosyltransferase
MCHFQLYYLRLPKDIKDYKVILMDATVATGAAAMMAIRVLLDHDVPEENILIVSLLMAEIGKYDINHRSVLFPPLGKNRAVDFPDSLYCVTVSP